MTSQGATTRTPHLNACRDAWEVSASPLTPNGPPREFSMRDVADD